MASVLEIEGVLGNFFIVITPRFIKNRSGSTCLSKYFDNWVPGKVGAHIDNWVPGKIDTHLANWVPGKVAYWYSIFLTDLKELKDGLLSRCLKRC